MKQVCWRWFAALVPAALLLLAPDRASGQGSRDMKVRKLDASTEKTPEYRTGGNYGSERRRDWLKLECLYETDPDWMDDLEFTYFVLLRTEDSREPFVLLKGTLTYVNVRKGKHLSVAYVHPSVLDRYGRYDGMAVEVRQSGRPVAAESTSPQYRRWVEQLAAREGAVLPPAQTPFAMIGFDNYEMVKPAAP